MGTLKELQAELDLLTGGSPFVLVRHNRRLDSEFVKDANVARELFDGQVGYVMDMSNAHGLCFKVAFNGYYTSPGGNSSWAWFDPDELERIPVKPVQDQKK